MDCYIENNCLVCIDCRGCSAVCPSRNIFISKLTHDDGVTHHLHVKDKEECKKCSKGVDKTPCQDICPEQCIEITWE